MKRIKPDRIDTLFQTGRGQPVFMRISAYGGPDMDDVLLRMFDRARQNGVVIEGKIPNPTPENLNYYTEQMGQDFRMDAAFVEQALARWLPRMNAVQKKQMAQALYAVLEKMQRSGKTEGMLRNAYTRFMCWLYFKFERVAVRLGEGSFPLVLYQGDMSSFEMNFLSILCEAGCDIVALQISGDEAYRKLDPTDSFSDSVAVPGGKPFPKDFSLKELYKAKMARPRPTMPAPGPRPTTPVPGPRPTTPAPGPRPTTPAPGPRPTTPAPGPRPTTPAPGPRPTQPVPFTPQRPAVEQPLVIPEAEYRICPNIWMTTDVFDSLTKPHTQRGDEKGYIYTCFVRREGVEDRLSYQKELIELHQKLVSSGRSVMIVDEGFAPPTTEETEKVKRGNYRTVNDAITGMAANFYNGTALELQKIVTRAFMEVMSQEAKNGSMTPQRVVSIGSYLVCWFRRCYQQMFTGWRFPKLGCLIYMGPCRNEREELFLRFMAQLPTDLLQLCPNLEAPCRMQDPMLLVQSYRESMPMDRFPREGSAMRISTAANQAERDLDKMLYDGSGLYRDRQFVQAQAVVLSSTSDEVSIYWNQELKYRPGFNTVDNRVMMPVIMAQLNGVPHGNVQAYWQSIKPLVQTENTVLLKSMPFNNASGPAINGVDFIRNGQLQRTKLREHRAYPFAFLREETQEHILNKLQLLIDQKLIKGTGENGTEYTIVSTVLGLKKEWVRMIQSFDFTKKNPKLLVIHTGEKMASREDAILLAFMSMIGFDVACYVPTGYNWIAQWYTAPLMVSHQIGDYVYDLNVPDFNTLANGKNLFSNIFRRGS